jgi:hypothetical protein
LVCKGQSDAFADPFYRAKNQRDLIFDFHEFHPIYFVLKNPVLSRNAGSSMGLACPASRESEFFGSA